MFTARFSSSGAALPSLPCFPGMLPLAPHLPLGGVAGVPDLRRDMLHAAYMYGRLPAPALSTCWPGLAATGAGTDKKDIPFWASLAAANQSLMAEKLAGRDELFRHRSGSNASSTRSNYSGYDDDSVTSYTPRRRSVSHTVTSAAAAAAAAACDGGHSSSPEPLELDKPPRSPLTLPRHDADVSKKRQLPSDKYEAEAKVRRHEVT